MMHEARPMEKVVIEKQLLKEIRKINECLRKYNTGEWAMNEANYAEFKRRRTRFVWQLKMLRQQNLVFE